MAKVTYGPLVAEARGKVLDTVYSVNKAGPFARTRVNGRQPRTAAQQAFRANITANTKRWSANLTQAQRDAWNARAAQVTKTNSLGTKHSYAGQWLYMQRNGNLWMVGYGPTDDFPGDAPATNPGQITAAAASASTSTIYVVPLNPPGPNDKVLIRATPLMPVGYTYYKSHLRNIGVI
jgi:hypothetical protein